MNLEQLILTAIGSLLGIVVGASLQGFFSLRMRQREYVNEYYKVVVQKRIAAYEILENLIGMLKTATVDSPAPRPYHSIFHDPETCDAPLRLLIQLTGQALWLTDSIFEKTQKLNRLLYRLDSADGAIAFGRKNYEQIAQIRAELEDLLANDMRTLYDVPRFFNGKKNAARSGFELVHL